MSERSKYSGCVVELKEIIAELEAQVANYESDAYVLSLLTKIDELEADLQNEAILEALLDEIELDKED